MSACRSLTARQDEEGLLLASDDRGHGGPSPPIVLFRYAPGRSGAFAEQFLQGFSGQLLQCDRYNGYERLTRIERPQGPWRLVHCWSHLRSRLVKQMRNTKSPIAEAAIRQIATLYAVEATVRGMPPEDRPHSDPFLARDTGETIGGLLFHRISKPQFTKNAVFYLGAQRRAIGNIPHGLAFIDEQ